MIFYVKLGPKPKYRVNKNNKELQYSKLCYRCCILQEKNSAGRDNECFLVYDEFISFYRKMAVRNEVVSLFLEISNGENHISLSNLEKFLREDQKMVNVYNAF